MKKDEKPDFVAKWRVVVIVEKSIAADTFEEALGKARTFTSPKNLIDFDDSPSDFVDGGVALVEVTNMTKWDPEA